MNRVKRMWSDITLRRMRETPVYLFLIWRWSMWFYALIVILGAGQKYKHYPAYQTCLYLLIVTLFQTLIVTLYAPVFKVFLPRINFLSRLPILRRKQRRAPAEGEESDIVSPLLRTPHLSWDMALYALDVIICGLVVYYSGPFGLTPNFGVGSPFYRYGMSTAFAAALAYRYRGGLAAAFGYDLFILLGAYLPPSGPPYLPNVIDITGSLVDTPVGAILAAYVIILLTKYTNSKKQIQINIHRQKALGTIGDIILRHANDKPLLLQKSAEAIRNGGNFQRLVLALINNSPDDGLNEDELSEDDSLSGEIEICIDVDISVPEPKLPVRNEAILKLVLHTGRTLLLFQPLQDTTDPQEGYARLYVPFFKDGQVQMILGTESLRKIPFDERQEKFLSIAGTQVLVALDNIRLSEQTIQLAAAAERTRIAREIHDGVAQIIYMLSLNAETSAAHAHRIAEASEEDAELITPLAERLDKLVTISKQALWETRNYMFSLKPLMTGTTTLTQMLTNQLREFETISDLPVHLEVTGSAKEVVEGRKSTQRQAQVGAAIFRIVQEALTNSYKHANATQLGVRLHYELDGIDVEICDNGGGLRVVDASHEQSTQNGHQHIYLGHGLRGMRERAEELGGTFELAEILAGGVRVHAWIPM